MVFRALAFVLNVFPFRFRLAIFTTVFHLLDRFSKRFRSVSRQNLQLVYPEQDEEFRETLCRRNHQEMARLIVDFFRIPLLQKDWVVEHIRCSYLPRLEELQKEKGSGCLIATGHLGSFELMGHAIAALGHPISLVVRPFKQKWLNRWWNTIRKEQGNKIIFRSGAFREVVRRLEDGEDVALLIDQNVRRKHAVFVDWFGMPAATTKALALAALKTKAPVLVAAMIHVEGDHYDIRVTECDFSDVYASEELSRDEKVFEITAQVSAEYQKYIRDFPEGWFWVHRRWKTRPKGESENWYKP